MGGSRVHRNLYRRIRLKRRNKRRTLSTPSSRLHLAACAACQRHIPAVSFSGRSRPRQNLSPLSGFLLQRQLLDFLVIVPVVSIFPCSCRLTLRHTFWTFHILLWSAAIVNIREGGRKSDRITKRKILTNCGITRKLRLSRKRVPIKCF